MKAKRWTTYTDLKATAKATEPTTPKGAKGRGGAKRFRLRRAQYTRLRQQEKLL